VNPSVDMGTRVVLWGATGQAWVLREALAYAGRHPIALFDIRDIPSPFEGVPLFVGEDGFHAWRADLYDGQGISACVAIGGARGVDRLERQRWLEDRGFPPLTVVHPRAFLATDARLGSGCQLLAMSAVASDTILGDATIVNTSASIDHGGRVGDGVHIAPGARLAGDVRVGNYAFIGTGAVVLPGLRIGKSAVVGAGAVVTRDVPDGTTVIGNPARSMPRSPTNS